MKRDTLPGSVLVVLPAIGLVIAAVAPLFRGRSLNATFLALAGAWIILGLAIAKANAKSQNPGGPAE